MNFKTLDITNNTNTSGTSTIDISTINKSSFNRIGFYLDLQSNIILPHF